MAASDRTIDVRRPQHAIAGARQQAAEDLLWIIERFANCADMIGRSSYKALVTIFNQQCEMSEGKVVVKAKTGGDCMQNPSDPNATYNAHKGQGYQVQIAETCSPENEVQLITGALPQSAAEPDGAAVVPRPARRTGRDNPRHEPGRQAIPTISTR